MMNKPRGFICACSDPRLRTVMELFREEEREGLYPVGRLDKDTEGLLIFTDDGAYCHRVLTPESEVKKTYYFYLRGELTDEKIEALEGALTVGGGREFVSHGAKVKRISLLKMRDIRAFLPSENPERLLHTKRGEITVSEGTITICEGKKHQVKRMAKAVGLEILYLRRISVGALKLDENLASGEYRPLTENEISLSYKTE